MKIGNDHIRQHNRGVCIKAADTIFLPFGRSDQVENAIDSFDQCSSLVQGLRKLIPFGLDPVQIVGRRFQGIDQIGIGPGRRQSLDSERLPCEPVDRARLPGALGGVHCGLVKRGDFRQSDINSIERFIV